MLDKLNRKIDYLRISVIDRCNLRCVYCMPEEGIESIPHDEILTYDEILRICEIVSELGIRKIKITGGEPLVRKDIVNLIRDIKNLDKVILWINEISNEQDYILVQGEFGATFYIVDYCFKNNLIPVYATSVRRVEEIREGDKVLTNRVFVHEGYRKYIRYEK